MSSPFGAPKVNLTKSITTSSLDTRPPPASTSCAEATPPRQPLVRSTGICHLPSRRWSDPFVRHPRGLLILLRVF
eukprot:1157676-Prorocentrum_minimum.AAC.1